MELRHLRYFVAVAEELHFARAASRLHIAQPALSLQIQSLERDLGVKLLIRNTRNVELTDAGSIFYDRSLAILNEVETTSVLTQIAAGEEIRKIRIGTIYPATFGFLHRFLSRIRNKYPDIKLHIKSDTTDSIVRDIERGNLNLGFVRPTQNMGSLTCRIICRERYLLAVSNENMLSTKEEIKLDDLKAQKIIAFARSNLTYTEKYFGQLFRDHGLLENISYTCNDTLSLIALVSAGAGVGFVPEWAEEFPNRKFVLRKVKEIDLDIGLALAWNKKDPIANKGDIIEMALSFATVAEPGDGRPKGVKKARARQRRP